MPVDAVAAHRGMDAVPLGVRESEITPVTNAGGAAAAATDAAALDSINYILSAPEWSVSMLDDIVELVRGTGRLPAVDAEWPSH